jgi:hypothetical protein
MRAFSFLESQMANSILTPTQVTREALRILHQKLNFVGSIHRDYDDQFAKSGAKIGQSLTIRLPNEYTVRTGKTLAPNDTQEQSTTLTCATQKGVDLNFSSAELTLELQDFSERILEPAMSVLAANIEYDAMSMYKDVWQEVSDVGAAITTADVLLGAKKLTDALCPISGRTFNMNTQDNLDLVEALKGLFNDPAKLSKQYREGMVANNFLGFESIFQNTMWPIHTTGTDDGTGSYLTDIAAGEANGSAGTLHVDTGAGTFKKGDVIMVESLYRVHPETKASTGKLHQFVVTADYAGGEGDLAISPNIVTSGARQNCTGLADGKKILKVESDESTAIGNAADYGISLGYHRDAFAFVSADLEMPKGVDFSSREVFDGISMRIVRQYDINSDNLPCRIDVLYGYKTIRAALATRYGFN